MKSTLTGVNKRIDIKLNKSDGIINYDIDNAYPNRVSDIIDSSGTATLCTEIMGKYIFGEGFSDEELGKLVINSKGETADFVLKKQSRAASSFNGVCFHVNYNALFERTEINFVHFEDVRFTTKENKEHPNMIAIYDDWQKIKFARIKKDKISYVNFYNDDPNKIQEEVNAVGGWEDYKGQLLFWSTEGIEYPKAPLDSVLEDVQTDAKTKNFKFRNISNNFMPSQIIEVGHFENESDRKGMKSDISEFQGDDNASNVLMLEKDEGAPADEDILKIHKVEIQDIEKLYEFTEESVRNNIIRNRLIPPVLLLKATGGFSNSEMKDAVALYNGHTSDYRIVLSELFRELLEGFEGSTFESYDIELKKADTVKIKDTAEGKVAIVGIVANTGLSDDQKINTLVLLYDLSNEEAIKLTKNMIVE